MYGLISFNLKLLTVKEEIRVFDVKILNIEFLTSPFSLDGTLTEGKNLSRSFFLGRSSEGVKVRSIRRFDDYPGFPDGRV